MDLRPGDSLKWWQIQKGIVGLHSCPGVPLSIHAKRKPGSAQQFMHEAEAGNLQINGQPSIIKLKMQHIISLKGVHGGMSKVLIGGGPDAENTTNC